MSIAPIEIAVLFGACALVIMVLRKPSWKKHVAVPLAVLVLLGAVTIVSWVAAAHRSAALPSPHLDAQTWQLHQLGLVDHFGQPIRESAALPRFAIAALLLLGAGACGIVLSLKRKWIARNASVLIPLCVVGFVGILAVGGVALPFVQQMREDSRRVELRQRLRAMGDAFHHGSSHTEGARSSSSEPGSLDVHENADVAIEVPIASSEETAANPETETKVAVTELPEWARGDTVDWRKLRDGVHQNPVVLVSDQWSSVQESEVQLEAMAARALQQQLLMDRGSYHWQPSKDFVHQSGAIQQQFVEQTSLKVGEFDTPMFRSYWQVSATPHVSELAQQAWKTAAIEERLTMLGAGAAILTLLFAGSAAGLRFDSATSGRYRRRMAAAVVAVGALAAGTAALFVA